MPPTRAVADEMEFRRGASVGMAGAKPVTSDLAQGGFERYAHLTVVLADRESKEARRTGRTADRGRRARVEASRRAQEKAAQTEQAEPKPAAKPEENA